MDYQQLWDRLEALLELALDEEQSRLPVGKVNDIRHYIDHREYGLAWDELAAALSELNLTPNEHAKAAMQQAAGLMYPEGG